MTMPYMKTAVLRVGGGRGFVVEHGHKRLIVTAAHCLPHGDDGRLILPPPHPASYLEERTYKALLGPLGAEPTVWVECLFADPIADIAVLGTPDDQELFEQAEAYEELVGRMRPLAIADAPKMRRKRASGFGGRSFYFDEAGHGVARLASLDGKWVRCEVKRYGNWLSVVKEGLIEGGMSGSPIVSSEGHAMGLISTNLQNPILKECLPVRFYRGVRS